MHDIPTIESPQDETLWEFFYFVNLMIFVVCYGTGETTDYFHLIFIRGDKTVLEKTFQSFGVSILPFYLFFPEPNVHFVGVFRLKLD